MGLDNRLLRLALYCAAEELRARRAGKCRVQPWNAELVRALELEVALSASGQEVSDNMSPSLHEIDDEWIGTLEAARILRWHERQARRRATDLEARKVAGKWIFHAATVRQYAEALNDDGIPA